MRSLTSAEAAKLRGALFIVCGACTLWLLVQNTILFTLLPWHQLPAAVPVPAQILRATIVGVVQLSLLPIAFALGWLASRRTPAATEIGERP